ncbi:TetR/AcrR family transcriptional regulator [Actinocorallia sp. API 0066]|nr:TetR/AcrR family transcriptional regulator [Actinocorallia sp. API 0066]
MLCGFGRHSAARGSGEGTAVEAVAAGRGHAPLHGQLLEAALVLFVERGYRGTSLQEIASAAGCSKASVLYHFSDKKAILRELLTPAIQGVVELNGRLHAVPDDRVARVAVEGFVEIALRYRREVALLLSDVPEVSEILVGPVDLAAVLLDAMAGRSRAPEAELRAWTALGCVVMGSAGSTDLILPFEEMRAHLVQATLRVLALPDG